MLNIKTMLEERIEKLTPLAAKKGYSLTYQETFANHGLKHGISISKLGESHFMAPILYYHPDWFCKTDNEVLEILVGYATDLPEVDFSVMLEREQLLDNVYPMILDSENLKNLRQTDYCIHSNSLFLILFYAEINMPGGEGSIKITKTHLHNLHISEEELRQAAFANARNTLTIDHIRVFMERLLDQTLDLPHDDSYPLYVISNENKCLGAVNMMLPETYQMLSEKLGERFIILPSSIHECIAVKYTEEVDDLVDMVTSINSDMVDIEDQLNNHVYLCSKNGISLLK